MHEISKLKEERTECGRKDGVPITGTSRSKCEKGRKNRMKKVGGKLWRLNPFVDKDGLLRVGGRLNALEEDVAFKHPVIAPKGTIISKRLVEWHHMQIEDRGKHFTISQLRDQGFWMINGSKEVGSVVYRCVRCK